MTRRERKGRRRKVVGGSDGGVRRGRRDSREGKRGRRRERRGREVGRKKLKLLAMFADVLVL